MVWSLPDPQNDRKKNHHGEERGVACRFASFNREQPAISVLVLGTYLRAGSVLTLGAEVSGFAMLTIPVFCTVS